MNFYKKIAVFVLCVSVLPPAYSAPAPGLLNAPVISSDLSKIGVVAAVTGSVKIESQGLAGRMAQSGEPVYIGDTVSTDSEGTLQILLLDETVFTIGPNSAIIIDKFIYDPASESGQVNAKVVKGVFRFVTGKIARKKPSDMKVDLPAGSIGVRGTIVAGEVAGNKSTVILLGPGARTNTIHRIGQIIVSNQVGGQEKQVTVTRPGFGTVIEGKNTEPLVPFLIPEQDLQKISNALETKTSIRNAKPGPEGKGADPSRQSGQDRARAREPLRNIDRTGKFLQKLGRESDKASQLAVLGDKVQDGISRLQELRRIQDGVFMYSQTGTTLLKNGADAGDTYDFQYEINFGNRTVGGAANSHITATTAGGTATYLLGQRSFDLGIGDAEFKYPTAPKSGGSCTGCSSTADINVRIQNRNGVIGQTTQNDISFTNSSDTYTGQGETGPRS